MSKAMQPTNIPLEAVYAEAKRFANGEFFTRYFSKYVNVKGARIRTYQGDESRLYEAHGKPKKCPSLEVMLSVMHYVPFSSTGIARPYYELYLSFSQYPRYEGEFRMFSMLETEINGRPSEDVLKVARGAYNYIKKLRRKQNRILSCIKEIPKEK